jgi:hypothetical protein
MLWLELSTKLLIHETVTLTTEWFTISGIQASCVRLRSFTLGNQQLLISFKQHFSIFSNKLGHVFYRFL